MTVARFNQSSKIDLVKRFTGQPGATINLNADSMLRMAMFFGTGVLVAYSPYAWAFRLAKLNQCSNQFGKSHPRYRLLVMQIFMPLGAPTLDKAGRIVAAGTIGPNSGPDQFCPRMLG